MKSLNCWSSSIRMDKQLGSRLFVPRTFAIDRYPHAWHDSSFLALCGNYGANTCFTPPAPPNFILQKLADKADLKFERPIFYQILVTSSINDGSLIEAAVQIESFCDGISLNFANICGKHSSKFHDANIDDYIQCCSNFVDSTAKIVTNIKVPVVCQLIVPGTGVGVEGFIQKFVALLNLFSNAGVQMILLHCPWRPLEYMEDDRRQQFVFLVKKIRKLVPSLIIYIEVDAINENEIAFFENAIGTNGIALQESALYDPSLFVKSKGRRASVLDISTEYLSLAASHNTDVRLVKNHLLMLWANVFTEQRDLQERLSKCTDLTQCRGLVTQLPVPSTPASHPQTARCRCLAEAPRKETPAPTDAARSSSADLEKQMSEAELSNAKTQGFGDESSEGRTEVDMATVELGGGDVMLLCQNCSAANRLPLWMCHARRKLKPPKRELASTSENISSVSAATSSKRLLRREKHYEEKREHNRRMRKIRRERAKVTKKEVNVDESGKALSKRLLREKVKTRLENAQSDTDALRICIDLEWAFHLSKKEQCRLGQQLCRVYGANRKATRPACLHVTSVPPTTSPFYDIIQTKTGHAFHTYTLSATERSWREVFLQEEVVYLSPDAPQPLHALSPRHVYVIGGIVDETKRKNCTKTRAAELGLQTYRLPIDEYMEKDVKGTYCKVLTVNQVFDIMLAFGETGSWPAALSRGIPQRAGFVPKNIS